MLQEMFVFWGGFENKASSVIEPCVTLDRFQNEIVKNTKPLERVRIL
jgi:hypothetical protein